MPGTSNYLFTPTDIKREIARKNFLLALLEIDKSGYGGTPVEDNPLKRLRGEFWPKWHESMHSPRPYLDFLSTHQENRAAEILDQWAADCGLVESVQDAALRPAGWIVAHAKQFCAGWSRTELGRDEPLWWAKRLWESKGNEKEDEEVLAPIEATMFTPSGMFVPMLDPDPCGDESWADFKKRARSALTAHLHIWEYTKGFATPESIETSQSASRASRRKRHGLEHYGYLVLYQCCKWSLDMIATPENLTPQAVSQGLHEKAKLVGLQIRQKH